MRCNKPRSDGRRNRRGAAVIESAIVLSVLVLVLFGLLDLGLMALNSNNLEDAAQQLTRRAMVRGKNAADRNPVWGPMTYQGTAASGDEIAAEVAVMILLMRRSDVDVTMQWPDGDNNDGHRVRVALTYRHFLIVPGLFGWQSRELRATSTMRIVH